MNKELCTVQVANVFVTFTLYPRAEKVMQISTSIAWINNQECIEFFVCHVTHNRKLQILLLIGISFSSKSHLEISLA